MTFTPGLASSRAFYRETVRPILDGWGLAHSAGRMGEGSDVLNLDTERSADHDWWHRLDVFVDEPARVPALRIPGLDEHLVSFHDVGAWLTGLLGVDPRGGMTPADWLAVPSQRLLEVTAGEVFHDGLGVLTTMRSELAFYPADVWRCALAGLWSRIGQEQPFVGRCGEVGDDLGSRIIAARLARDVLRLTLLYQRRYPPYAKWLGTAAGPNRHLTEALGADSWPEREAGLLRAYAELIDRHNDSGLTPPVDPTPKQFHDRPFHVVDTEALVQGLRCGIGDPWLRDNHSIGGVDAVTDNTDVLCSPTRAVAVGRAS